MTLASEHSLPSLYYLSHPIRSREEYWDLVVPSGMDVFLLRMPILLLNLRHLRLQFHQAVHRSVPNAIGSAHEV